MQRAVHCDCRGWNVPPCWSWIESHWEERVSLSAETLKHVSPALFWRPNIDPLCIHIVLIKHTQRDVEVMKYCRMELETWTRQRIATGGLEGGVILFNRISFFFFFERGKIHELLRHFSTALKTLEFSLQTFEYRSEACYIRRRPQPAWMYVCSFHVDGTF